MSNNQKPPSSSEYETLLSIEPTLFLGRVTGALTNVVFITFRLIFPVLTIKTTLITYHNETQVQQMSPSGHTRLIQGFLALFCLQQVANSI